MNEKKQQIMYRDTKWQYRFIVNTIICETHNKNLERLFCRDCKRAEHVILTCNSYQPVLFLTMVSANIDRTIPPCLTLILSTFNPRYRCIWIRPWKSEQCSKPGSMQITNSINYILEIYVSRGIVLSVDR